MKENLLRITMRIVLGVALLCVGWIPKAEGDQKLNRLMADKLRFSQRILEGIALADYTKITQSAEELIQLSRTAEWFAIKTPRYELNSNEFRRAAEGLIAKAKTKNLDGVVLAYQELTMSCVRCHEYVREVRDARLPLPEPNAIGWLHR
ncbi:MAG: hypothetical protein U0744_10555 [Gemmataceae bacterium]